MKRFNVDELIWFIILVLLSLSIVFLIRSGNITNFVGSDMINYFYLSIIILVIFAIFQFERIFTIKRRVETTNKFLPLTFTLCVGVVLLYIFPLIKAKNIEEQSLLFNNAIVINSDSQNILYDIQENTDKYEGEKIVFLGYIDTSDDISDFTIISRERIKCCQADKEKIQIKTKGINEDLKSGQWITIYGEVCFDNEFYIYVEEYKLQNEPKDIYFHEHL